MLAPATAHRAARAALIGFMALLSACGARSALRMEEQGSSGEGGSGAAGGGGGMGGAGGAPLTLCTPVGFSAVLGGGEGWHQRRPELAFTSDDLRRVTIASAWSVAEAPGTLPVELRHASFYPWDAWPQDNTIAPSYLADLDGGASFAVASSQDELLALAFTRPGDGVWFSPSFVPDSGATSGLFQLSGSAEHVLFSVAGDVHHLTGFDLPRPPPNVGYETNFASVDEGSSGGNTFVLGCSDRPSAADGTRVGDRWIFAYATGAPMAFTTCTVDTPSLPPTKVQVIWSTDAHEESGIGHELTSDAPFVRIQMAPQPDGAWLVVGDDAPGAADIVAVRVNEDGVFEAGPLSLGTSASPGAFSADRVGDLLALAWVNPEQHIQIELFDRDGARVSSFTLVTNSELIGAPAVLGWPDSRRLLVAWSETPQTGGGDRVRVMRLDCGGEE